MVIKHKWKYEFEEYGGYDCMTDAYYICDGNDFICKIDLSDYSKKKAEEIAKLIIDSVNKRLNHKN